MKRSSAPDFERLGFTWQCWVTDENTYVWITSDKSMSVGRVGKLFWAKLGDKLSGQQFTRLVDAMEHAMIYKRRAAA